MDEQLTRRARMHAALGERPGWRSWIVAPGTPRRRAERRARSADEPARPSPASPAGRRSDRPVHSEGDRRRTYVQLRLDDPLVQAWPDRSTRRAGSRCPPTPCGVSSAPTTPPVPSWPPRGGWPGSAKSRWPAPERIRRYGCIPRGRRGPPTRPAAGRARTRAHRRGRAAGRSGGSRLRQRTRGARPARPGCTGRFQIRCGSGPMRRSTPPVTRSTVASALWPPTEVL